LYEKDDKNGSILRTRIFFILKYPRGSSKYTVLDENRCKTGFIAKMTRTTTADPISVWHSIRIDSWTNKLLLSLETKLHFSLAIIDLQKANTTPVFSLQSRVDEKNLIQSIEITKELFLFGYDQGKVRAFHKQEIIANDVFNLTIGNQSIIYLKLFNQNKNLLVQNSQGSVYVHSFRANKTVKIYDFGQNFVKRKNNRAQIDFLSENEIVIGENYSINGHFPTGYRSNKSKSIEYSVHLFKVLEPGLQFKRLHLHTEYVMMIESSSTTATTSLSSSISTSESSTTSISSTTTTKEPPSSPTTDQTLNTNFDAFFHHKDFSSAIQNMTENNFHNIYDKFSLLTIVLLVIFLIFFWLLCVFLIKVCCQTT
jgi:hypothetical protein